MFQVLSQYLSMLQALSSGDDQTAQKSFSEIFSGWLEEKGIIGYNRWHFINAYHVTCVLVTPRLRVFRKFVVAFSDKIVFYDDETRSNVKDRCVVAFDV